MDVHSTALWEQLREYNLSGVRDADQKNILAYESFEVMRKTNHPVASVRVVRMLYDRMTI